MKLNDASNSEIGSPTINCKDHIHDISHSFIFFYIHIFISCVLFHPSNMPVMLLNKGKQ